MSLKIKAELKELALRLKYCESLDFHPTKPWVLTSTSSQEVSIHDFSETLVRKFHVEKAPVAVGNGPVPCGKFVANKQWIVVGTQDSRIVCFDYNTAQQLHTLHANCGPIRNLSFHPTSPLFLSCSKDKTHIRAWNWDREWKCVMLFLGHTGGVEQMKWHPENPEIFVSTSRDKTVRIWNVTCPSPMRTISGFKNEVTLVDFYTREKELYIVTGGDDSCVKLLQYPSGNGMNTLNTHLGDIVSVSFLRERPYIVAGSVMKSKAVAAKAAADKVAADKVAADKVAADKVAAIRAAMKHAHAVHACDYSAEDDSDDSDDSVGNYEEIYDQYPVSGIQRYGALSDAGRKAAKTRDAEHAAAMNHDATYDNGPAGSDRSYLSFWCSVSFQLVAVVSCRFDIFQSIDGLDGMDIMAHMLHDWIVRNKTKPSLDPTDRTSEKVQIVEVEELWKNFENLHDPDNTCPSHTLVTKVCGRCKAPCCDEETSCGKN